MHLSITAYPLSASTLYGDLDDRTNEQYCSRERQARAAPHAPASQVPEAS